MGKELTPWFPVAVKPAHAGVYCAGSPWTHVKKVQFFSYWDGEKFNWIARDVARAFEMRAHAGSGCYVKQWRGLAKKP